MTIYDPLAPIIPPVIQATLLATGVLVLGGVAVKRQLRAAGGGVVPDEGVTLRNVCELIVESLISLARDTMGPDYRQHFPIVATMFVFILISNLIGLVPGFAGATSWVETTAAWAVISFVVYNAIGIRKHGFWYINQFLGPSFFEATIFGRHIHVRPLAPVFFVLEVPLHFARILTLAVRLLANMYADHTVVAVWLGLVPVVVPAIFLGLGALVAFLQALVFALLTMIYIGLALEDPH